MSFGYNMDNVPLELKKDTPIRWISTISSQISIYIGIGIPTVIMFFLTISLLWKSIILIIAFSLAGALSIRYNNQEWWLKMDGRTLWEWFLIWLRKNITWNKAVDRGADYDYFYKRF